MLNRSIVNNVEPECLYIFVSKNVFIVTRLSHFHPKLLTMESTKYTLKVQQTISTFLFVFLFVVEAISSKEPKRK